MDYGQRFHDRINRYQLDPELLMKAMQAIADMDPEDRKDISGRTITVIRVVHDAGLPLDEEERIDCSMAINFRLTALAELDLLALPEWRIAAGRKDDPDLLHENVLRCAAVEPLVRKGEDLIFDLGSFTKRLSAMAPLSMESRLHKTVAGYMPG